MQKEKLYVGIDIGKDKNCFAYNDPKSGWKTTMIANKESAIESYLDQNEHLKDAHFILEATGVYSLRTDSVLNSRGMVFTVITPQQSSGYSKVTKSISKTDKADAKMLAEYGKANTPDPKGHHSAEDRNKKMLINQIGNYQKQRLQCKNRLAAMEFDKEIDPFYKEMLEEDLVHIEQRIASLEERMNISKTKNDEEQIKLIQSIKGIGKKTASVMYMMTNGFRQFENVKQVAKAIGLGVVVRESGKKRGKGRICKGGMTEIRKLLYMCAKSASKYNRACKELFIRLKNRGKAYKVAMIAVANNLLRQAFAVIKTGRPYDPKYMHANAA